MLYSPSQRGFYVPAIHGAEIPGDVVEITNEEYEALLAGQAMGYPIEPGQGGRPVVLAPPPSSPEEMLLADRAAMVTDRFQLRVALHNAGLLAQADTVMGAEVAAIQIAWADAQTFRRTSATIAALAAALELDDVTMDQLFHDANDITA